MLITCKLLRFFQHPLQSASPASPPSSTTQRADELHARSHPAAHPSPHRLLDPNISRRIHRASSVPLRRITRDTNSTVDARHTSSTSCNEQSARIGDPETSVHYPIPSPLHVVTIHRAPVSLSPREITQLQRTSSVGITARRCQVARTARRSQANRPRSDDTSTENDHGVPQSRTLFGHRSALTTCLGRQRLTCGGAVLNLPAAPPDRHTETTATNRTCQQEIPGIVVHGHHKAQLTGKPARSDDTTTERTRCVAWTTTTDLREGGAQGRGNVKTTASPLQDPRPVVLNVAAAPQERHTNIHDERKWVGRRVRGGYLDDIGASELGNTAPAQRPAVTEIRVRDPQTRTIYGHRSVVSNETMPLGYGMRDPLRGLGQRADARGGSVRKHCAAYKDLGESRAREQEIQTTSAGGRLRIVSIVVHGHHSAQEPRRTVSVHLPCTPPAQRRHYEWHGRYHRSIVRNETTTLDHQQVTVTRADM
ncbi:hypothetical protein BJ912DRAFT_1078001 [Pholiota molesta]|nr:hypothetical protein BJ912DRAFT_1078001 [Pholiota molesta]